MRRRWGLGVATVVLALTGTCVASARLDARFRNPDGIPITHPARQPVADGLFELFTSNSPDGAWTTVMQQPLEPMAGNQTLLVVDGDGDGDSDGDGDGGGGGGGGGVVVGRLTGLRAGGRLGPHGWRDPTTLWVSVVDYPDTCVAAYIASPPSWDFTGDDCGRPPGDAASTQLQQRAPSPDGTLIATRRYDRSGPWDFGDGATPVPDVRLEDANGRFLVQLGNLDLVGWTMDGNLLVTPERSRRPYVIERATIDRIVGRAGDGDGD